MEVLSKIGEFFFDDGHVSEEERLLAYQKYKERQRHQQQLNPSNTTNIETNGAVKGVKSTGSSASKLKLNKSDDKQGKNAAPTATIGTRKTTATTSGNSGNVSTTESATSTGSSAASRSTTDDDDEDDSSSSMSNGLESMIPETVCADLSIRSVSTRSVISESGTESGSSNSRGSHKKKKKNAPIEANDKKDTKKDTNKDENDKTEHKKHKNQMNEKTPAPSVSKAGTGSKSGKANASSSANSSATDVVHDGDDHDHCDHEHDGDSNADEEEEVDDGSHSHDDTDSDDDPMVEKSQQQNDRHTSRPAKRTRIPSRGGSMYARFLANPFKLIVGRSASTVTKQSRTDDDTGMGMYLDDDDDDESVSLHGPARMLDQLLFASNTHTSTCTGTGTGTATGTVTDDYHSGDEDDDDDSSHSEGTSLSQEEDSHTNASSQSPMKMNVSVSRFGTVGAINKIMLRGTSKPSSGRAVSSYERPVAVMSATLTDGGFEAGIQLAASTALSYKSSKTNKSTTSKSTRSKAIHGWIENNRESTDEGDAGGEKIELAITNSGESDDDDQDENNDHDDGIIENDHDDGIENGRDDAIVATAVAEHKGHEFLSEGNGAVVKATPSAISPRSGKTENVTTFTEESTAADTYFTTRSRSTKFKSIFQQKGGRKPIPEQLPKSNTKRKAVLPSLPLRKPSIGTRSRTTIKDNENHETETKPMIGSPILNEHEGKKAFMDALALYNSQQRCDQGTHSKSPSNRVRSLPIKMSSAMVPQSPIRAASPQFFTTNLILEEPSTSVSNSTSTKRRNDRSIDDNRTRSLPGYSPPMSDLAGDCSSSKLSRSGSPLPWLLPRLSPRKDRRSVNSGGGKSVLKNVAVTASVAARSTRERRRDLDGTPASEDDCNLDEYIEITYDPADDDDPMDETALPCQFNDLLGKSATEDPPVNEEPGREDDPKQIEDSGAEDDPKQIEKPAMEGDPNEIEKPPAEVDTKQIEECEQFEHINTEFDSISKTPLERDVSPPKRKSFFASRLLHRKKKDKHNTGSANHNDAQKIVAARVDKPHPSHQALTAKSITGMNQEPTKKTVAAPVNKPHPSHPAHTAKPITGMNHEHTKKTVAAPVNKPHPSHPAVTAKPITGMNHEHTKKTVIAPVNKPHPSHPALTAKPITGMNHEHTLDDEARKAAECDAAAKDEPPPAISNSANNGFMMVFQNLQAQARDDGNLIQLEKMTDSEEVEVVNDPPPKENPKKSLMSLFPGKFRRPMTSIGQIRRRSLSPMRSSKKEATEESTTRRKKWVRSLSSPKTKSQKTDVVEQNPEPVPDHSQLAEESEHLPIHVPLREGPESQGQTGVSDARNTDMPRFRIQPEERDDPESCSSEVETCDSGTEVTYENPWRTGHPNYYTSCPVKMGKRPIGRGVCGSEDDCSSSDDGTHSEDTGEGSLSKSEKKLHELKKAFKRKIQEKQAEKRRRERHIKQQTRQVPVETSRKAVKFGNVEIESGDEKHKSQQGLNKLKSGLKGILRRTKKSQSTEFSKKDGEISEGIKSGSFDVDDNGLREMEPPVSQREDDTFLMQHQYMLQSRNPKWKQPSRAHSAPHGDHEQSKLQRVLGRREQKKKYRSRQDDSTTNSILDARTGKSGPRISPSSSYSCDNNTIDETTIGAYSVQNERVLNTLKLLHAVKKHKGKERTRTLSKRDRRHAGCNEVFMDPIIDEIEDAACGAF